MSQDDKNCLRLRHIQENVATVEECKNLCRIHKGACSVGYMPDISITTLRDLCSLNSLQHFLPVIALRDRIREIIEDKFDCFGELYYEWTSITCWHKGSFIKPHYDSNREYLKQRHFSALLYLNSAESAESKNQTCFQGGSFVFTNAEVGSNQSSNNTKLESATEYLTITPKVGQLICFSSGIENEHLVTKIEDGNRYVLTLWFTKDPKFVDPELKYFLNEELLNISQSLWETKLQRFNLEKKLLSEAGFSFVSYAGMSDGHNHRKRDCSLVRGATDLFWLRDTKGKDILQLVLVSPLRIQIGIEILVEARTFRIFLQFAAFVENQMDMSLGSCIANVIVNHTADFRRPILEYLDSAFYHWLSYEQSCITKLEKCKQLWAKESTELVGSVADFSFPDSYESGNERVFKYTFCSMFSPTIYSINDKQTG